jgi:hypothetical protein
MAPPHTTSFLQQVEAKVVVRAIRESEAFWRVSVKERSH